MSYAEQRAATDTQIEGPMFVSLDEHDAVLTEARETQRQRDELADEVARLRTDAALVDKLRAQLEDARVRMGRAAVGAPRELLELRETLEARDHEIRRLRDSNLAREKLLVDARDRIEALMHERAGMDARASLRERAVAEIEARAQVRERAFADLGAKAEQLESALATECERLDEARGVIARTGEMALQRESERDLARAALVAAEGHALSIQQRLGAEIERLENESATVHEQLEEVTRDANMLRLALEDRVIERDTARFALAETAEALQQTRQALDASEQTLQLSKLDAESARALHAQEISAARESEATLALELAELRAELDGMRAQYATIQVDLVRTLSSLDETQTALDTTRRSLSDARDAHTAESSRRDAAHEQLQLEHSDAVRVLEAAQIEALAEMRKKHAAEVEHLLAEMEIANADLSRQLVAEQDARAVEVAALEESSEHRIAAIEGRHAAEIMTAREAHSDDVAARERDLATLRAEHQNESMRVRVEHATEIAQIGTEHAEQIQRSKAEHEAQLARAKSESTEQLERLHTEHAEQLARMEAERREQVARMQTDHEERVAGLRAEHDAAMAQAAATQSAEIERKRVEIEHAHSSSAQTEGTLRGTIARLAEAHVTLLSEREASHLAALARSSAEHDEAMSAREESHAMMWKRRESEHAAAIEALEASALSLREEVTARTGELETERDGLRVRVVTVERERDEARAQRDRASQKLAEAMRKVTEGRRQIDAENAALAGEAKKLSRLVAELTLALVTQTALVHSHRHGHDAPEPSDVDEAIDTLTVDLPESVTEDLWAARDAIHERATAERFA